MIVSTSLIRRRPDLSPEAFRSHWLDPHGPLTAKLPGTRRYDQNHVVETAGTNRLARLLGIDGFAQLAFDSPESRVSAHSSPELKACDQDSQLFIGAVSRVISDDSDARAPAGDGAFAKQILLAVRPASAGEAGLRDLAGRLDGVEAAVHYRIIQQGPAPNSAVPFIGIEVGALAELWVRDADAAARNAERLDSIAPGVASFAVEVYRFA